MESIFLASVAVYYYFNLAPNILGANLLYCRRLVPGCRYCRTHHPWKPHLASLKMGFLSPGAEQHLAGHDFLQKQPLNLGFETQVSVHPDFVLRSNISISFC